MYWRTEDARPSRVFAGSADNYHDEMLCHCNKIGTDRRELNPKHGPFILACDLGKSCPNLLLDVSLYIYICYVVRSYVRKKGVELSFSASERSSRMDSDPEDLV